MSLDKNTFLRKALGLEGLMPYIPWVSFDPTTGTTYPSEGITTKGFFPKKQNICGLFQTSASFGRWGL